MDLIKRIGGIELQFISELQEREFALQKEGFKAVKHQSFVGTTYFDAVQNTITLGNSSTMAMNNSTEVEQFKQLGDLSFY